MWSATPLARALPFKPITTAINSMKTLILIFTFCLLALNSWATSFTEFYVQQTATNINAGSTTNDVALYTSVNGSWNGTNIFTPTDGTTPASSNGVAASSWASVYYDGETTARYVAMITNVAAGANGAISFGSNSACAGLAPTNLATARSIKVGGAWMGMSTNGTTTNAQEFPFGFAGGALTNALGNVTRVNIKGGTTYQVTNGLYSTGIYMSSTNMIFQGYTNTPGDGGKATIDGGTNMPGYILLTTFGKLETIQDLIFSHNGTNGTSTGLNISGVSCKIVRCIVNNMRGKGLVAAASAWSVFYEDESYSNNLSGTADAVGIDTGANSGVAFNCVSHDNIGINGSGFGGNNFFNCISYNNGRNGFDFIFGGSGLVVLVNCDSYNNNTNGVDFSNSGLPGFGVYFKNCNFFKNGLWAINSSGVAPRNGEIVNCTFGSGTQASSFGNICSNLVNVLTNNLIIYAANNTPWVDPANGNFTMSTNSTTHGLGRGYFTQSTIGGTTNTVSYPDIGATQGLGTNTTSGSTAGGEHNSVFAQ
jgi:hypothetical protein